MMESIAELREKCQKSKLQSNTGLTLLNRRLSIYITWLVLHTRCTPGQLSLSNIVLGLIGGGIFILDTPRFNLLAILVLYVSFLFDQVDGEVARYYQTPSFNLLYLDEIRHLVIYAWPVFCLSYSAYWDTGRLVVFALGCVGALILALMRVNGRIALLIYMDRAVLRSSFGETDLVDYLHGQTLDANDVSPGTYGDRISEPRARSRRAPLGRLFYWLTDSLCDQVTILFWLLGVTMLDMFLAQHQELKYQTAFFLAYVAVVTAAFCRTAFSWCKEDIIKQQCQELNARALQRYQAKRR